MLTLQQGAGDVMGPEREPAVELVQQRLEHTARVANPNHETTAQRLKTAIELLKALADENVMCCGRALVTQQLRVVDVQRNELHDAAIDLQPADLLEWLVVLDAQVRRELHDFRGHAQRRVPCWSSRCQQCMAGGSQQQGVCQHECQCLYASCTAFLAAAA